MWVDRIALTFTSPEDQTTCGSSFGSKVIVLIKSAGPPGAILGLGVALRNLARFDECVGNMRGELSATYGEAQHRNDIGATHGSIFGPVPLKDQRSCTRSAKPSV
jgi:hypothetical protein